MYKKFFMGIAAIAALTLVSCSSDDLNSLSDNSSKNEAISFDGYLGRSAVAVNGTRGSVETTDKLKTDGFGVFSTYTGGDQSSFSNFVNQKVTCPGTKWTYSPLKFWPTQGTINFFAYAPYVENKTLTNTSFEFTVDADVAKQTDLLWAKGQVKTNKEPVKFTFNHALSRLGYTVKLYGNYSSDDVTNKAKFELNQITLAGSADGKTPAFYKNATIDLSKAPSEGPWSKHSSDKQKFDWVSTPYELTSTDAYNPNKENNYLFVIPQNFSEKIGSAENPDKLYVIVEYTITYNDGKTQTNKVYKQLTHDFKQGKAYMLNLTIGLPIEFDADVTDWGDDDSSNIDSWDDINH